MSKLILAGHELVGHDDLEVERVLGFLERLALRDLVSAGLSQLGLELLEQGLDRGHLPRGRILAGAGGRHVGPGWVVGPGGCGGADRSAQQLRPQGREREHGEHAATGPPALNHQLRVGEAHLVDTARHP